MLADGSIAPTPELGEVRNVAPKTRTERLSVLYKEDLEKSRLRARREGYYRHEEAGITQPEGSLGSISDADRFVTDVAAVNKNERDAAIAKQEQMYYAKRLNNADREEKRWRTIEMEDELDNKRWEEMREHGTFSRSNKTSVPYNPISLEYDAGCDGDRLRFSDDTLRYRSALRADHLQRRMNGAGYNPITGAPMERIHVPDPPRMPSSMAPRTTPPSMAAARPPSRPLSQEQGQQMQPQQQLEEQPQVQYQEEEQYAQQEDPGQNPGREQYQEQGQYEGQEQGEGQYQGQGLYQGEGQYEGQGQSSEWQGHGGEGGEYGHEYSQEEEDEYQRQMQMQMQMQQMQLAQQPPQQQGGH